MNNNSDIDVHNPEALVSANKQSLKYAEDLAEVYKKEKLRRQALQLANQKIVGIMDSMTDGMIATDRENVIIEANGIAAAFFEKKKEELIGKNILDLLGDLGSMNKFLTGDNIVNKKINGSYSFALNFPNKRHVRVSVSELMNDSGVVLIMHDITSEKRAEELKHNFLSILSHELRTPLSAIIGFSNILISKLTGKDVEFAEKIKHAGDRMNNAVNELLSFVHLQSDVMETKEENIDIRMIISCALEALEADRKDKSINFESNCLNEDHFISGNFSMLLILFTQVINNAIIFGKKGGDVKVNMNCDNVNVIVSIEDNGIGIPACDINKVFDSFYQVENPLVRSHEGLGLGLTLSKHIVERHNGSISIESRMDEGTKVTIKLPKLLKEI